MNVTTVIPPEFWTWTASAVWHFLVWVGPSAWLVQRCFNGVLTLMAKMESIDARHGIKRS